MIDMRLRTCPCGGAVEPALIADLGLGGKIMSHPCKVLTAMVSTWLFISAALCLPAAGQLPGTLAEITEVSVPAEPITGEAFRYERTGSTAVLESSIPAGGNEKDRIRYEIAVKN
jgi:hypothetical protein